MKFLRFGLRTLLVGVTVCAVLVAIVRWTDGYAVITRIDLTKGRHAELSYARSYDYRRELRFTVTQDGRAQAIKRYFDFVNPDLDLSPSHFSCLVSDDRTMVVIARDPHAASLGIEETLANPTIVYDCAHNLLFPDEMTLDYAQARIAQYPIAAWRIAEG